jgi:hypothetical protein
MSLFDVSLPPSTASLASSLAAANAAANSSANTTANTPPKRISEIFDVSLTPSTAPLVSVQQMIDSKPERLNVYINFCFEGTTPQSCSQPDQHTQTTKGPQRHMKSSTYHRMSPDLFDRLFLIELFELERFEWKKTFDQCK